MAHCHCRPLPARMPLGGEPPRITKNRAVRSGGGGLARKAACYSIVQAFVYSAIFWPLQYAVPPTILRFT